MGLNFTDFYIGYKGHPAYRDLSLIEDDIIRIILQKYEMILYTEKGDLFGDSDFGSNLEELLFETKVAADYVENELKSQINKYIPEISNMNYQLSVQFFEDTENYQDYMEILFQINDYEVYTIVG